VAAGDCWDAEWTTATAQTTTDMSWGHDLSIPSTWMAAKLIHLLRLLFLCSRMLFSIVQGRITFQKRDLFGLLSSKFCAGHPRGPVLLIKVPKLMPVR